jgi:hypothetical protein
MSDTSNGVSFPAPAMIRCAACNGGGRVPSGLAPGMGPSLVQCMACSGVGQFVRINEVSLSEWPLTVFSAVTYAPESAPLLRFVERDVQVAEAFTPNPQPVTRKLRILQVGQRVVQSSDPAHPVGEVTWKDVPLEQEGELNR